MFEINTYRNINSSKKIVDTLKIFSLFFFFNNFDSNDMMT